MTEPKSAQAAVLADVLAFAEPKSVWLTALRFALLEHAEGTAPAVADNDVRRLAVAMLDAGTGIQVDHAEAEALSAMLAPYAARCRVEGSAGARAVNDFLMTVINRLRAATEPQLPASDDVIEHRVRTHEDECVADPPIRFPPVLSCPCPTESVSLVRCSKCGQILEVVFTRGRPRCEHLDDACTGLVDGWRDVDDCMPA